MYTPCGTLPVTHITHPTPVCAVCAVLQGVSVLEVLLQRAAVAAAAASEGPCDESNQHRTYDRIWPGLETVLDGLPGLSRAGRGWACFLGGTWSDTVRGAGCWEERVLGCLFVGGGAGATWTRCH
jgi:hypothetical protein